jgi:serine/threonine protein kinase
MVLDMMEFPRNDAGEGRTLPLATALGHLHSAGFGHRDVKSDNYFTSGGDLKLADFGPTRDLSARRPLAGDVTTG